MDSKRSQLRHFQFVPEGGIVQILGIGSVTRSTIDNSVTVSKIHFENRQL